MSSSFFVILLVHLFSCTKKIFQFRHILKQLPFPQITTSNNQDDVLETKYSHRHRSVLKGVQSQSLPFPACYFLSNHPHPKKKFSLKEKGKIQQQQQQWQQQQKNNFLETESSTIVCQQNRQIIYKAMTEEGNRSIPKCICLKMIPHRRMQAVSKRRNNTLCKHNESSFNFK